MQCPRCQATIPERVEACPNCGEPVDLVAYGDGYDGGGYPPPPPQPHGEPPPEQWDPGTDPAVAPPDGQWAGDGSTAPVQEDAWQQEPGAPIPGGYPEPPAPLDWPSEQQQQQRWPEEEPLAGDQSMGTEPGPADVDQEPAHNATRVLSADPERDKHTRVVQAPPPPKFPPKKKREAAAEIEDSILSRDFEIALSGAKAVYKRLRTPERVALWATIAAFVASFSPWYYVRRTGLISGVQTHGWIPAVLTGLALVLLYLRFSLRWGILPSILQFFVTAGAAIAAVYFTLVPSVGAMRFGLPATAVAASVAAVAALLGMLSRT